MRKSVCNKDLYKAYIWNEAKNLIDKSQSCLLIGDDDTVLDKSRSQKVDLVNWQYSGNARISYYRYWYGEHAVAWH